MNLIFYFILYFVDKDSSFFKFNKIKGGFHKLIFEIYNKNHGRLQRQLIRNIVID